MKNTIRHFTIIFLVLGLLGYTNASEKIIIKVGYLPILDHLTLLVSYTQDNNSFEQVEIRPKMFKAWREMVGALKAGVIDAAFILSPLAMDLFNDGFDIKTVLLAHRDGSAITVQKDSAIHSAADLKGKAIAIPDRKSTHTALLNKYLIDAGLSLKEVTTKVIAPPNMLKAMKLGRIEAFIVAEPFGAKAQHDGIGRILVLTKDIINNHVECVVIVRQQLITNHRLAVQEWVNSLIRAGKWIDQDKLDNGSKQVAAMTSKYLPHSESTIMLGLQNPSHRISFSDLSLVLNDFQTIMDISRQAGIIKPVNLEDFIEKSFFQNSPNK